MLSSPRLMAALAVASLTSMLALQAATAQDSPIDAITPVTDETLLNPPDGDWLMWRRTYDGWGYSPLEEITKEGYSTMTEEEFYDRIGAEFAPPAKRVKKE